MKDDKIYIPKKGDIVWINFNPSAGKEIQKRRPGLVISRTDFNRKTMFAVVCPITSTIKKSVVRFDVPDELKTPGQVLLFQLKSLDFKVRQLEKIETMPPKQMMIIDQIISYIFEKH